MIVSDNANLDRKHFCKPHFSILCRSFRIVKKYKTVETLEISTIRESAPYDSIIPKNIIVGTVEKILRFYCRFLFIFCVKKQNER